MKHLVLDLLSSDGIKLGFRNYSQAAYWRTFFPPTVAMINSTLQPLVTSTLSKLNGEDIKYQL